MLVPRAVERPLAVRIRGGVLALFGALLLWSFPAPAEAYVYFTNGSTSASGTIGRAELNGSGVNQDFITGTSYPRGIAVDASHVYWTHGCGEIGRADLDGSNADPGFVTCTNDVHFFLAVDAAHIYYSRLQGNDSLGRSDLDGLNADSNFIDLPPCFVCFLGSWDPYSVAVDSGHVYWSAVGPAGPGSGGKRIGRANLDGTGVDMEFISGLARPQGIAIDDDHIYWTTPQLGSASIGRADLDGSNVEHNFITGLTYPEGIAVDDGHIYWTSPGSGAPGSGAIGRANLDGTGVDQSFITGLTQPESVAVDALGAPPNPDTDGDGIDDEVDTDPLTASDGFADDNGPPATAGTIVDRAGLEVQVEDLAAPDGVKVTVGAGGGQAELLVCGVTALVPANTVAEFTCGSVEVHVITGAVEIVLGDGITVVSIPEGATALVTENPDGSFEVENLGDPEDPDAPSITITVDGETTTVDPGDTTEVTTWHFVGFTAPVDNPNVLNVVKAGQAVPLKWRLVNADGSPVSTLGNATITVSGLGCTVGSTPDLLEEVAPGGSGLKNHGNGYYQLNWKTPKTYAGSCKALHLDLGEGITRKAYFKFTK